MLTPGLLPLDLFFEKKKNTNCLFRLKKNENIFNQCTVFKKNKKKTLSLIHEIVNKLYYCKNFQKEVYLDVLRFKEISIKKELMILRSSLGIELHLLNQNFEIKSLFNYLEEEKTNGVYKKGSYDNSFIIIYNIENFNITKQKEIRKFLEKLSKNFNVILVGSKKNIINPEFQNFYLRFKNKKLKYEKSRENKILHLQKDLEKNPKFFPRNTLKYKPKNLISEKKTSQLSIWSFLGFKKTIIFRKINLTEKNFLLIFDPFSLSLSFKLKNLQIFNERCVLKSLFRYYLKDITKEKTCLYKVFKEKWKRVEFLKFSFIINILMRGFNKINPTIFS